VERIFAIGFALDQLHLHLRDLARCLAEFAPGRSAAVATTEDPLRNTPLR